MRTAYEFLSKENPILKEELINLGLREQVCNIMDRFAIASRMDEHTKTIKEINLIINKTFDK